MEVPGYALDVLLGAGPGGEVWRARNGAGEVVALKRLTAALDREVVQAAADRWQAAATPYAVRLREVLYDEPDPVLVLDFVGGGCLTGVLDRRERMSAGEIVTLGVPLAEALAAAHAVGLVHGSVSAANVLLTEGGMALLADLGVAQMRGTAATAGTGDPAADLLALGELLQQALDRCPTAVPPALREAVAAAAGPEPGARPDAATLAISLRRSCPAAPLLRRDPGPLPGALPAAGPRPPAGDEGSAAKPVGAARARRRPIGPVRRRLLLAMGTTLGLAALAGAGWASGRGGPTGTPLPPVTAHPAASPRPAGTDWRAELDRIDAARAVAFSAVDPAMLEAADAPGSPAMAADRAALAGLKARGLAADGVRHRLLEVRSVLQSPTGVSLRVVDERTAVTTVDRTGRVAGTVPLRARAAYDIELVRGPAGWRLARVTPAAATPPARPTVP